MAAFERGWRQLGTRLWQQLYREHGTCIYGKYGVTLDANDEEGQAVGTESLKAGRNVVPEHGQRTFGGSQYAQHIYSPSEALPSSSFFF